MLFAWSLGVLAAGAENAVEVAHGVEPTMARARGAAVDAIVRVAIWQRRQEFRLAIGGVETIILPGRTEGGNLDFVGLTDAVYRAHGVSSINAVGDHDPPT